MPRPLALAVFGLWLAFDVIRYGVGEIRMLRCSR